MRRALILATVLAVAAGAGAPAASAGVPIRNMGLQPSSHQAGGHPDLQIAVSLENAATQQIESNSNTPCDCQNVRFLFVHAPRGLVGDPHATPQCTSAEFATRNCPVDSQVGVIGIGLTLSPGGQFPVISPIFNLAPRGSEAGLLGFSVQGTPIFEVFSARTGGDYGLDTTVSVYNGAPLRYFNQILWGVPASPAHDPLRFPVLSSIEDTTGDLIATELCDQGEVLATPNAQAPDATLSGPESSVRGCSSFGGFRTLAAHSNSPEKPFIEAPTSCGESLHSSVDILSWDGETTHAEAPYPEVTGCDQLSFNPSLAARASSTATDSPSGLDAELTVPQFESPTVPSPAEIRATEMTLPEGFSINSNAADGKTSCADSEAKFGTEEAAECPEGSKIGTLTIETALLPGPLPGYLYLGEPLPGNRYRVFLVADGFDVHVKLPGRIEPDPRTGQLKVIFENLPETPFQKFSLHIFGSERGALATPTKCGSYGITTTFTPWDSVLGKQASKTFFEITEGPNGTACPGPTNPFNPGFEAASEGNTAGAHSPFALRLSREDGNQYLSALDVKTPPGFAATLKGIPYCSDAAIAAAGSVAYTGLSEQLDPTCPAASQVGEVIGGAGAGSSPFYAPGKAYLAGPYKGAPLSLVVVVPAVEGPYDLGNIVVRNALYIDPESAQVSAVSDPLPQIIEGVPLRVRSILVRLNRPNFALNPTNCDPFSVDATIGGEEGGKATVSSNYQVANCARLPFAPKLSLKLKGGTRRSAHPALTGTLKMKDGGANIRRLTVALPHSEFLDQAHIKTICTRVQFAAHQCPPGSVYGHAKLITPLLGEPLEGPVYLRSSSNPLPDLVIALKGPPSQPIEVVVDGKIDTDPQEGIRTTFQTVPDDPVSSFTLSMAGGRKGLLENSTDICANRQHAIVNAVGQNGRRAKLKPSLEVGCRGRAHHKRKHRADREGR